MTKAKTKTQTKSKKTDAKVTVDRTVVKIEQVGWINENPNCPLILLSKGVRERIGVNKSSPVKVRKGDKEEIAIVSVQFKEHISKSNVCSINTKLAYALKADKDDTVELNKEVTESEYADFKKDKVSTISFQDFLDQIR